MMNHVTLVGRLVRDPELKPVGKENQVATFTVAIDDWSKKPDGSRNTFFIPCTIWGKGAENTYKYARKGLLVGVEGRLTQRSYDRKDGTKAYIIDVNCDSVQFLESSKVEPKPEEGREEPTAPEEKSLTPEEQAQLDELLAKKG